MRERTARECWILSPYLSETAKATFRHFIDNQLRLFLINFAFFKGCLLPKVKIYLRKFPRTFFELILFFSLFHFPSLFEQTYLPPISSSVASLWKTACCFPKLIQVGSFCIRLLNLNEESKNCCWRACGFISICFCDLIIFSKRGHLHMKVQSSWKKPLQII